jgi:hypothetical protein
MGDRKEPSSHGGGDWARCAYVRKSGMLTEIAAQMPARPPQTLFNNIIGRIGSLENV